MANWVADLLTRDERLASLPVFKRARHSLHFVRLDGKIEAHFTGAPCHYEATPGDWRALDTALIDSGSYWGNGGLPARIRKSDRAVEIIGSGYSQRTARVAVLRPSTMALRGTPVAIPIGTISGDSAVASGMVGGAPWSHTLTLTETGVRETLTLDAKPTLSGVTGTDYLVLETIIVGATLPDGELGETTIEGMRFPLPRCWDANGAEAPTRRIARTVTGTQYLYTGVPLSWLATAQYPVTVDPDFAAGTADGEIYGYNGTYATARSTSYASSSGTNTTVGQIDYFLVSRGFLTFDTSGITTDNTVTQVNLTLTCVTDITAVDFDVNILKHNWLGTWASNREADFDGVLTAPEDASIWRNTSGMSTNTAYTSGNLATDWVVRDGTTKYSLASNRDYDGSGTQPGYNGERIQIALSDHATAGYRPVLTVLYEAAGGGTVWNPAFMRHHFIPEQLRRAG